MDNILKYNDFLNERKLGMAPALIGLGLMAGTGVLSYKYYQQHKGKAELDTVKTIGQTTFKNFDLLTQWEHLDLTTDDDIIVCYHSYTEGTDEDEETYFRTNLIIPAGVSEIWYKDEFMGNTYASRKQFPGSTKLILTNLNLFDSTPTYSIYTTGQWLSVFDYIIVVNGHKEGEEFKFIDQSAKFTFVADKYNDDIYVISLKGMSGGNFGGGGSGGQF